MLGSSDNNSSTPTTGTQTSKEDKSYFAPPPALSLPNGGGAIKGMGEKFAANPVTGTGSMSVPISTTPGRSGFGPQLSLSYDSGSGNGIFGMGWSLALPMVTRKTDKGLPRYGDAEESDVFILSGAEDLVPILKAGKFDEIDRDGYSIRKYRPRIEGLFARIERWTKLDSGDIHWRSISKDNITTLYGKTEESRIADPENLTHVFSYLICESYDDRGNAIYYRYKSEDKVGTTGIDLAQANEGNRTPQNRSSNRYLKHIYYGNQKPRAVNEDLNNRNDWLFEMVFDYGEHDLLNPVPTEPVQWTTATLRNDPFSVYRSGFEVRTYRLCQRVLMFHHFSNEEGVGKNCLVRSTDLTYTHEQNPRDARNPSYSFLKLATQTGYKRNGDSYLKKSLPPLEFTYSEPIVDERVWEVDRQSLENLPQGLDGTRYQWVDLEGEGLSGILTEQGGGWFYKRNLSPINPTKADSKRVEAQFAAVGVVKTKPASGLGNGAQFMDLAGDGQPDVVTLRGMTPGFYERTQDEDWDSFVAFKSLPNLDWDDPNLKFIDLDGDGHSDILITEDNCFVWYPSLAEAGFGAAKRVSQPWNEDKGARVVFADSSQSIHLADMSGDGLTDIVRIRNGEVCYWTNLGYGRFGAKVTMDAAPWFDRSDIFNQRRILLADIDGSGTTDILYLCAEGVQVYFNQSGNSWSAKQLLKSFPAIDSSVSVTTLDLLGNGTACLVWSSPLLGSVPRVMRYIDLMGGQKPHLLVKTVNNMGSETIVQYAPSTKFYLEDERKGQPWITKLPFLVHVVERVETYDRISGNRFVSRSAYHHGYFDGVEREFRGFGMVEQWDTEEIGTIDLQNSSSIGTNLDTASFIPPVHTKTWFHTGVYIDRERISNFFAKHEYYREPQDRVPVNATEAERQLIDTGFMASLLPDTILPSGLTAQEEREAVRSLKGQILRQEIYALDGSDKEEHPYSVSERNYEIRLEQGIQTNRHGIFFTHDRETIDYHYERNPNDPRVSHAMTLEVDEFGNGLKSVAIAYPHRQPAFSEQGITHVTYTENWIAHEPDRVNWYRIGVPIETRTYELTGYSPTGNRFQIADFVKPDPANPGKFTHIFDRELNYEDRPTNGKERRPIEWVRALYRPNNQANTLDPTPLALGTFESLALPCESFKLAFTLGLLAQIYGIDNGNKIPTNEIAIRLGDEGKYRQLDGNWWIPSGRQQFAADRFFIVTKTKDPFGHEYAVTYDDHALLTLTTTDPVGNTVQVKNDYRVMQPQRIIDPNQNQVAVAFDILGMVAGTAVLGKVNGAGESESGDTLDGFVTDLSQEQIRDFRRSPSTVGAGLLGKATTRIIYDLESFQTAQQPLFAATIARENHVNSANGNPSIVQVSFSYSDGFGREIQKKIQAESGDAPQRESNAANLDRPGKLVLENGKPKMLPTDPRWVGNGRTIFNNKGKPVKQYEPFFSSTHLYEDESELVMTGVTPIMFYDPAGRVVATLHPNHTFEKVLFDPWRQETWDVNDTVAIDPKIDLDVGGYFKRLLDREYLPTWYSQFSTSANPAEKDATQKALAHAGTPAIAHLDTLGRTFLTIADNGAAGKYETRVELDLEGNTIVVTDHRQNAVMIYAVVAKDGDGKLIKDGDKPRIVGRAFDLLGHNLYSYSMDAGDRWMLNNVAGKPIRAWNDRRTRSDLPLSPKGHLMRTVYDVLQRPTHLYVQPKDAAEILVERLVYGEQQPEAVQRNLKGQPFQHYDGAGVVSNWEFDFKGNLLRGSRQLAKEYKELVNWLVLANLTEISQVIQAAMVLLEPKTFDSLTTFDAMNRPITLTAPDRSIIYPIHNQANLLEKVEVQLRGAAARTVFVKDINYDAKGQRQSIEYGSGVKTEYSFDRDTFRLTQLLTTRMDADGSTRLQDLNYTYDPVGNITTIQDAAQQKVYFSGEVVSPSTQYTYDPLYRLITAAGREHIGQTTNQPPETNPGLKPQYDSNDWTRRNLPHPSQAEAMRNYTESYEYDGVGNILAMIHAAGAVGSWRRDYNYAVTNNRLLSTTVPGLPNVGQSLVTYDYDEHGNMTKMPHLPLMRWDFKDQLQATSQQIRNDGGTPEITYFVYDASGQRVRKVTEAQAAVGQIPQRMKERMYLGGFEVYREYNGDVTTPTLERETLHIMDDKRRIALVETKIVDVKNPVGVTQPVIRYQLDNHLGSASLELDGAGKVISYEEYYPYGSTSYQAGRVAEVSLKRYRYTGMERDEETGLAYHGARYYAAWLGRWASCDPIRIKSGLNLYCYSSNRPTTRIDPNGMADKPPSQLHLIEQPTIDTLATNGRYSQEAKIQAYAKNSAAAWGENPEHYEAGHAPSTPNWKTRPGQPVKIGPQHLAANNEQSLQEATDRRIAVGRGEYSKSSYTGPRIPNAKPVKLPDSVVNLAKADRAQLVANGQNPGVPNNAPVPPSSPAPEPTPPEQLSLPFNKPPKIMQAAPPVEAPKTTTQPKPQMSPNKTPGGTLKVVGGTVLNVAVGALQAKGFYDAVSQGDATGALVNGTGFAGTGLVVGSGLAGSLGLATTTTVAFGTAGSVLIIPGAAYGLGKGAIDAGSPDFAASAGAAVDGSNAKGPTVLGGFTAATTAIVTSPYFVVKGVFNSARDTGTWLGDTAYRWLN
jgi:RHS repeat-associated protein